VLVGREHEIALLVERIGRQQPVALLGEAGVGKTTLVRAAAERAGTRLVEAGGLSTLSWLPYFPLRRAFDHDFEGDPAYVATAVEEALGDSLLFVDDLQWADPQTAALLPLLAGRVRVIAAIRRGDANTAAALERAGEVGLELFPLEPLVPDAARELARSLHPGLSEAATRRLVERSGGNPFLLEQLAASGETSESLRLAVAARMRDLTPQGRSAMAALALIGRPAAPELLGDGAGEIVEAGLATADGDVAIRHALLAEATLETLSEEQRRSVHSRLAASLGDTGEAARHHAAAGERALAHEKALAAAARATSPGERAGHLGVAAAASDGVEAEPLRVLAARELMTVGECAQALEIVEALRPADTDLAAEAALLRAQAHMALLHIDDAHRELAAAESARPIDPRVRVALAASRSRFAFREGDYSAALAAAEDGARLVEETGVAGLEAAQLYSALGSSRTFVGAVGSREAHRLAVEAARTAGAEEIEFSALGSLGFGLLLDGRAADAERAAAEAVERARALRVLSQERFFRCWHAGFLWHLGEPARAASEAEEVLAEGLVPADRELVEPYWWHSMNDIGKGEAVRATVEDRIASAPLDDDGLGDTLWALADIELATGRPDAAERATTTYFEGFGRASTFVGIIRAWAEFEQDKHPSRIPGTQLRLVEGGPVEVDALIALSSGDARAAAEGFDRAASLWDGRHVRGAFRCRWAAADALRRVGAEEEARERLLALEPEAERRQLQVVLRRIRRSLRLLGVHRAAERTHAGVLTGREAEVLELVAGGLTNDEIARRLGIGRPTVVRLIKSAQQKLGATSRTQAAAMATGR
jgi:DNA-binding CsgD family transcriptional regulator